MVATTGSGQPIHCEGCNAPIEEVTEGRKYPVPDDIAGLVYGLPPGELHYICCPPLPNGSTPCLDAAIVADELHYRVATPCGGPCCAPKDPQAYEAARRRVAARGGKLLP